MKSQKNRFLLTAHTNAKTPIKSDPDQSLGIKVAVNPMAILIDELQFGITFHVVTPELNFICGLDDQRLIRHVSILNWNPP